MPFDSLAMTAVADELRDTILGGRIQKIIQPSESSVALSVYAHGEARWVIASADARLARVHLACGKLAKAFPTPSAFVMLLRKYLEGDHVTSVEQKPGDRVLFITGSSKQSSAVLVVEVMGKHSNLVLLAEDRILGALKIVPPHLSRVRPILVGHDYVPPPPQPRNERLFPAGPRLDPAQESEAIHQLLATAPPESAIGQALQGLLTGASPFLCGQIALRAGVNQSTALAAADLRAVTDAAADLYRSIKAGDFRPTRFVDERGRCDFAPYEPVGVKDVQPESSMSTAIESCIGQSEARDGLLSSRTALLALVIRAQRAEHRKLDSLRRGLQAAQDAESLMLQGQMVLAYQHEIAPRASLLEIPELGMSIPLDPSQSATTNAEKYFRRYRKLRDARSRLPELIAQTEARLQELEDVASFVRLASSEADLSALRRDMTQDNLAGRTHQAKEKPSGRQPLRFTLNGYVALIGRSARQNDELTFRLANRDDLWLHARERTGAHVILKQGKVPASDEVITKAAELAAFYSEGRNDTAVDVDVTVVRLVRKIPGGPPGRVTYRQFRTVRVAPDVSSWEPQARS